MRTLRLVLAVAVLVSAASARDYRGKPQLIPNRFRYREDGFRHAKGRAGSAVLEARALLGSDGKTQIELTTGKLDSNDPRPGQITRVTLQVLNAGRHERRIHWNHLHNGGYFTRTLPGFIHGQQLQLIAHVEGIDGKRVDVVSVPLSVTWRPDLSISELTPAEGMIDAPITISAVVSEIKGDTGAVADCVLYVDGSEVDRAKGINVAASGNVTCSTMHAFDVAGEHQLRMALEAETPADFGSPNDEVEGKIQILKPVPPKPSNDVSFYAEAQDQETSQSISQSEQNYYQGVLTYDSSSQSGNSGWTQYVQISFWRNVPVGFPLNAATILERADGAVIAGSSLANLTPDFSSSYSDGVSQYTTAQLWRVDSGFTFQLTAQTTTDLASGKTTGNFSGQFMRSATEVTYYSSSLVCHWQFATDPCVPGSDSYIDNSTPPTTSSDGGQRLAMGSLHQLDMSLQFQQGGTFSAVAKMPIQTSNMNSDVPMGCSDWTMDPDWRGTSCYGATSTGVTKYGSASFDYPQQ